MELLLTGRPEHSECVRCVDCAKNIPEVDITCISSEEEKPIKRTFTCCIRFIYINVPIVMVIHTSWQVYFGNTLLSNLQISYLKSICVNSGFFYFQRKDTVTQGSLISLPSRHLMSKIKLDTA